VLPGRDAEMLFERRRIVDQGAAGRGVDDAAAIEDDRIVGDPEDFFGMLLDDDGA
jgi:hypothetical protein